jgi:diguanylate cyclase (GGDEF)-like protein
MSTLLPAALAAAPLAAGWSAHLMWMRRQLAAAHRDPLTGLWTREVFEARARRLLRGETLVLLADVNDFKAVNDTHGHAAGDAVLAAIGGRLERICGTGVVGRLGGDEFAAVVLCRREAESALAAVRLALCLPVEYEGRRLPVSVSLGAAPVAAGTDLPSALRRADEAMYAAKRADGGWCVADETAPAALATVNGRRVGRPGTHHGGEGER